MTQVPMPYIGIAGSVLLGGLFIAESLVHGKAAEVGASAFDALLRINLKAMVVEKQPRCKTGVGKDFRAGG